MATRRAPKPKPVENGRISNKLVLKKGTEFEKEITLQVPFGKEGRKATAKLLPLVGKIDKLTGENVGMAELTDIVFNLWDQDEFEDELLPTVLGLDVNDETLVHLGMMEALLAFVQAVSFILSDADSPEVTAALKK